MRCSVTSAIPVGLRSRVPAKITSSMRTPRSDFADCSPSTQAMASEMLDFPQPLGPTMAATPSPGNLSSVRSQKDLKPRIWTFLSFSKFHSLRARARPSIRCPFEAGQIASAVRFGGNFDGLQLQQNRQTQTRVESSSAAAPYAFDAVDHGLPVVDPSGWAIHTQSAEAALAPPEDFPEWRTASRAVGWCVRNARFQFLLVSRWNPRTSDFPEGSRRAS